MKITDLPDVANVLRDHGGDIPRPDTENIIPTRYPYTYAYDFFRQNVPGNLSRAECSQIVKAWAVKNHREPYEVVCALADAYLIHNNVQGWK